MNEPQKAAYAEGFAMIVKNFQAGSRLDMERLTALINAALSGDTSIAGSTKVVARDGNGEIEKIITHVVRRNERAGYVLIGAFNAVEGIRAGLAAKGVSFTVSAAP